MADSQAYCLRRANHTSDLIDVFDRMFRDESLTDCLLMCSEGHSLKAHRMVLSASSPFFKTVFDQMSIHWPNYPIVYLKDMPISDLRAIIEFIYRGEVTVGQEQLESVLRSGESLKIKGLEDIDNRDIGGNTATTISKRRKRRRRRPKPALDENRPENECEEQNNENNSSDDMTSEYSEDGSSQSLMGTPTDLSGSRTYNDSVGASEDGIEPSRLLEQSMITGDTQESNSINQYSSASTPHLMSNIEDEDVKPILYEEPIGLMAQISSALTHDLNSDSTLNHNTNETANMRTFDTSGIPSIAGTSSSLNAYRSHSTNGKACETPTGFVCLICQKRFDVRYSLIRHIRVIHEQKCCHVCGHCGRQFTWKSAYLRHINITCPSKPKTKRP